MSSKELEVYDESCYPGAEEDELELSSNDQTCLALDDKLPPSDVTCSICSDILIDPVSLHCGHTYCQLCLARVWRSRGKLAPNSLTCPVCRLPWRNYPGVNITLRYDQWREGATSVYVDVCMWPCLSVQWHMAIVM